MKTSSTFIICSLATTAVNGFTFTPLSTRVAGVQISRKSTFLKETNSKEDILEEANEALASVGWSRPLDNDEMTSDDPFVKRIDAQIQEDFGVNLDELLNPAKVRQNRIKLCGGFFYIHYVNPSLSLLLFHCVQRL